MEPDKELIDKVLKKFREMPKEEFRALLDSHKNGDIAIALRELSELSEFEQFLEDEYNKD